MDHPAEDPYSLRSVWVKYKQGGAMWNATRNTIAVTGSRAGDALGVGYNSRWSYYREQRAMYLFLNGLVDEALGTLHNGTGIPKRPTPSLLSRDRMAHGTRWESHALSLFRALELGHDIYNSRLVKFPETGLVLSPQNPSDYGASPDAYIPKPMNSVVEIKCRYPNTALQGAPSIQCYGGEQIDNKEGGFDSPIPVSHLCQMILEMHCTGATSAYYVCLGLETATVSTPCLDPNRCYQYRLVVQKFLWDQALWDRVVGPRLQCFAQAIRAQPGTPFPRRMQMGEAKKLKEQIRTRMMKHSRPVSMYKGYTSMNKPV